MVSVDKGSEDTCEITTRKTHIPQECPSRVGDNTLDVRYCPNRPCYGGTHRSECNEEQEMDFMCCSPIDYEKLQVPCYGFVLGIISPAGCECKPCDKSKAMSQIRLNGRVLDRTGRVPLRFGKVWLGGVEVTETDILGAFSIALTRGIERLVLTFTDPRFSTFHEATKVLHLRTNKNSISYTFHVPLLERETASIKDNTIMIGHKENDIVQITLPEGTDMKTISIYGNIVSQSIYGTTYKDIIGDSFTIDDYKLEQPVSMVLLVCLTIMNESETALDIPGTYSFAFNKMHFKNIIERHEIEKTLLFELNAASGYWTMLTEVDMIGSGQLTNGNFQFLRKYA